MGEAWRTEIVITESQMQVKSHAYLLLAAQDWGPAANFRNVGLSWHRGQQWRPRKICIIIKINKERGPLTG